MIKFVTILFVCLVASCTTNKKITTVNNVPACLQALINEMAAEPNGSPQSVTSYFYKIQTVYYLVSPCCDKYNVVYDSACNIIGYPDGGITGKGDGKLNDFATGASNKKIVWQISKEK